MLPPLQIIKGCLHPHSRSMGRNTQTCHRQWVPGNVRLSCLADAYFGLASSGPSQRSHGRQPAHFFSMHFNLHVLVSFRHFTAQRASAASPAAPSASSSSSSAVLASELPCQRSHGRQPAHFFSLHFNLHVLVSFRHFTAQRASAASPAAPET